MQEITILARSFWTDGRRRARHETVGIDIIIDQTGLLNTRWSMNNASQPELTASETVRAIDITRAPSLKSNKIGSRVIMDSRRDHDFDQSLPWG